LICAKPSLSGSFPFVSTLQWCLANATASTSSRQPLSIKGIYYQSQTVPAPRHPHPDPAGGGTPIQLEGFREQPHFRIPFRAIRSPSRSGSGLGTLWKCFALPDLVIHSRLSSRQLVR